MKNTKFTDTCDDWTLGSRTLAANSRTERTTDFDYNVVETRINKWNRFNVNKIKKIRFVARFLFTENL
jgi:hypothetical protein